MEACGTSYYWAREILKLGHEVRLMPPEARSKPRHQQIVINGLLDFLSDTKVPGAANLLSWIT